VSGETAKAVLSFMLKLFDRLLKISAPTTISENILPVLGQFFIKSIRKGNQFLKSNILCCKHMNDSQLMSE